MAMSRPESLRTTESRHYRHPGPDYGPEGFLAGGDEPALDGSSILECMDHIKTTDGGKANNGGTICQAAGPDTDKFHVKQCAG